MTDPAIRDQIRELADRHRYPLDLGLIPARGRRDWCHRRQFNGMPSARAKRKIAALATAEGWASWL